MHIFTSMADTTSIIDNIHSALIFDRPNFIQGGIQS